MGRQAIIIALFSMGLFNTLAHDYNEFKRMPDLRGQSFGLENFLLQPFNIASQAEDKPPSPKRRDPTPSQFSLEYQVQNDDFDVRKLVPTLTRAPQHHFTSDEPHDVRPVHEFSEPLTPPPLRRRPPNGEPNTGNPQKRRILPPETRRPLEKPSEFQLSLIENEPFIPQPDEARPERQRKRVMKRRRKRPSTPQPQLENEFLNQDELPKLESTLANIFGSDDTETPTSYQHTMKDSSIIIPETITEHKNPRKRPQPPKRQREPLESLLSSIAHDEEALQYEDKLVSQASQRVPQRELPQKNDFEDRKPEHIPVTEIPQEPTQKLKTLLKQQNGQLSLSEVLQTQNLSLSDFLKGNPGALSALGGNKVNNELSPISHADKEMEKPKEHKPHIPKISSKSRPFSKQYNNNTKIHRKTTTTTTTTEEPLQDLPKKLQIIEVTSDKPTYNGFAPKNPRRGGQKSDGKPNYSKEKSDESTIEDSKSVFDFNKDKETEKDTPVEETKTKEEKTENESSEVFKSSTKSPTYRLTTPPQSKESTISEHRVVPKRYGDYRAKLRIDRRKPTLDGTTEGVTIPETQEDTAKIISSTEEIKSSKEIKNRVRIPFMSVNNPEISLIIPNKRVNVTTERPKERTSPVIKDRINLFKRLNSEEKQINENTVEVRESISTESSTITVPMSSSTETTHKIEATEEATDNPDIDGNESSDEIVELLKTGSNAQRLHRILAARNMTVTELLEKRANSSKQPNVTHLFEKKIDTGFSSNHKITQLSDNHHPSSEKPIPSVTTKKVLPVFLDFANIKTGNLEKIKIKPIANKAHETNTFDELFVDESMVRPIKLPFDKDENREPKAYDKTPTKDNKNPGHRVHLNLSPGAEGKAKHPMPLWNVDEKSIYNSNPYGYPTYDLNKNLAGYRTTELNKIQTTEREAILLETVNRNLDSNHRLKTNINEILKEQVEQVDVIKENNDEKTFIPPAVKSAIIASGVVMGIALIVFVAIFAACGWKQRQFRLRARSSILNDSLNGSARKTIRRTGTLSPVSFKRSSLYKKSIDFEDTESSVSSSSNTSSYLWNTLKHTFQSRNSTLKNRQEKEEKIQERESRSRRNTLSRDEERGRRNTISRDDQRRDSVMTRETDLPRRNTLTRDDLRRDSVMSRDTLSRDLTRDSVISRDTLTREDSRRNSCFRDDNRRLSSLLRENERCSFKKIDPDRNIIQTSVNFKRGGFNSSRHFDSCDHFN